MADISISLESINGIKNVEIKPFGDFKVRQLGAGESLDLSQKTRRMGEIFRELQDLDAPEGTDAESTEKRRIIADRVNELSKEIEDINRFKYETFMRCFDDGGNGKTKELFHILADDARDQMIQAIFNPQQVVQEKPSETQLSALANEEKKSD